MSLTGAMVGAAERYQDLGIPIVPVAGKQALTRWRKPPEPGEVLDIIASDPRCTGIAGVMGPTTNLVCRDWDDPDAWHAWRERYPAAARSVPMVGSARAGHAYTVGAGVLSRTLPDGELRARGCYVLLPPSLTVDPAPGAPRQYQWITPLPRSLDLIPRVDMRIFYPGAAEATPEGEEESPTQPPNPLIQHVSTALGRISIRDCIDRTVPTGPGQRYHRLWDLARWLRATLPPETTDATIRGIADEWHGHARLVIRTKDVRVTRRDLLDAWRNVEFPAGCTWGGIVENAKADDWRPRTGSGSADRIARLLRAASHAHGGAPFYATYERIAEAVGGTPQAAHKAAKRVVEVGLAEIIDRGSRDPEDRKATVWRWLGP